KNVQNFRRELNMKEGWLSRSFTATMPNNVEVKVDAKRFLSLELDELAAIKFSITPINSNAEIAFESYLDAGITNEDSNWDDQFWNTTAVTPDGEQAFIEAHTMKTHFYTCTFMQAQCFVNENKVDLTHTKSQTNVRIGYMYASQVNQNETFAIHKFAGYTVDRNHDKSQLVKAAKNALEEATSLGFDGLLELQKQAWSNIWEMADITIEGDVKAQQGIRFNIFQLNQTYLGKDARLNIGPKGFTGEKYGGSTY